MTHKRRGPRPNLSVACIKVNCPQLLLTYHHHELLLFRAWCFFMYRSFRRTGILKCLFTSVQNIQTIKSIFNRHALAYFDRCFKEKYSLIIGYSTIFWTFKIIVLNSFVLDWFYWFWHGGEMGDIFNW